MTFLDALVVTRILGLIIIAFLILGCAQDRHHQVLISTNDQKMVVFEEGHPVAIYPISTSKFGVGDDLNSKKTPLGRFSIRKKIGTGAALGTVFKDRKPTGEILTPNAVGRDPIVTRILWIEGKEPQNKNAFRRHIYIHGTTEESWLGKRRSYGCIRMSSADVVKLYEMVGVGADVYIVKKLK